MNTPDIVVALERFWEKVEISSTLVHNGTPCQIWVGGSTNDGYAMCHFGYQKFMAHRWIYEVTVGKIPHKHDLDHLCRNRLCVNTAHMEPVLHKENLMRSTTPSALNKQKTHCLRGHEFTHENTRKEPGGGRKCRECERFRRETRKK